MLLDLKDVQIQIFRVEGGGNVLAHIRPIWTAAAEVYLLGGGEKAFPSERGSLPLPCQETGD